jgi:hypothetical protein
LPPTNTKHLLPLQQAAKAVAKLEEAQLKIHQFRCFHMIAKLGDDEGIQPMPNQITHPSADFVVPIIKGVIGCIAELARLACCRKANL